MLGELVNGRAAASCSLVYGPSAYSLRACNGRRGLLAHRHSLRRNHASAYPPPNTENMKAQLPTERSAPPESA